MKLDVAFPELEQLVRAMGAKAVRWKPSENLSPFEAIRQKLEAGIDVKLEQVRTFGGLLVYEGQQVLLYIKDNTRCEGVLNNPEVGRRFHLAECKALRQMRAEGRFERYVATIRKDGLFRIDYEGSNGRVLEAETELLVCQFCLGFLKYKDFHVGDHAAWRNFDLEEFFGMYSTFFESRPIRSDLTAIPEKYVRNWSRMSNYARQSAKWTCENCGVRLQDKGERKWLHVHHIDGVKTNNAMSNLRVLCIECHEKQPGHQGLNVPKEAKGLLSKKRSQVRN